MLEKVCITGLGGRLGSILFEALEDEYDLTALNRRTLSHVRTKAADITDFDSIKDAFQGQDVVIHLAAYPFADDNWEEILPANIVGTHNVLQAALRAGVKRFIFGSSLSILGGHLPRFKALYQTKKFYSKNEKTDFLEALDVPRVDSLYGASKVFGEALCRLYADLHGMSCVCLRLAEVRPDDRPNPDDPFGYAIMCRHEDFIESVKQAIRMTRKPCFEILTLISDDNFSALQRTLLLQFTLAEP